MTEKQLSLYDKLINQPTNDWDIYYWMTGLYSYNCSLASLSFHLDSKLIVEWLYSFNN